MTSLTPKLLVSVVLALIALYLFIEGAGVSEASATRDSAEATYFVGAAIVLSLALLPWTRD